MASRLYRTTRQLYLSVEHALRRLHVHDLGTPALAVLIALTVTGLIVLDTRPTQTRVARVLPGRCHDALNRLLRQMPWSTRMLTALLIAFAKRRGRDGYLVLDDVIVEQAYARRLPWASWTYSFAKKRKLYGVHIVVLVWCSLDGHWRIPVGIRLWRPKRACRADRYRTKLELALELVRRVVCAKLPLQYIVGDTHYTAGWFTKRLTRLGVTWHGTLDPKTHVVWRGNKQAVRDLAAILKLKRRQHLGVWARAVTVFAPSSGQLRLGVTRNRHGNYEYLVSNDRTLDLTSMVHRKRRRWSVETVFRDSKQFTGLEACQCWSNQALVRHVNLVFLTFVVLQLPRATPDESVDAVKERWQLAVIRDGQAPPEPLRACPSELRPTA